MPLDAYFPPSASLAKVLLVFAVSLGAFSAWLVWWKKIGKPGLRVVECVWILTSGLTIIKYVADIRQLTASNAARTFDQMEPRVYDPLRFLVEKYSGPVKGPACMTFNRSSLFPSQEEFDRMQRDFDAACAWFEAVSAKMPLTIPIKPIDRSALPPTPQVSNADLRKQIAEFYEDLDRHNEVARKRALLDEAAARSDLDVTWTFLAPLIVAAAIALRLTKVLGEWTLDRRLERAAKGVPASAAPGDSSSDLTPSAGANTGTSIIC